MSIKSTFFSMTVPQPQTLCKFAVCIPEIRDSIMYVSSADFPLEVYAEDSLWVNGQPIFLPTRKQVPGEWRCVFEESVTMSSNIMLKKFLKTNFRETANKLYVRPKDIVILVLDEFTGMFPINACVLKGAWLKSIDPINLDFSKVTDTLKWSLKFRYSFISTDNVELNKNIENIKAVIQ